MQYPAGQTPQLESEKAGWNPVQLQDVAILGLPNELLLRIIFLLPAASIRNFMVNRSLRSLCEQALYQSISLSSQPRRSIRLLETFLLRPDLALLVRHLAIDFSWRYPEEYPQDHVTEALRPDGLAALSRAKNIHSLSLEGVADWIWEPDMAKFRQTIFGMKLTRLEVPVLRDPHTEYICVDPPGSMIEINWDGDLGDEIRRLLQAQPLLEEFNVPDATSITYKTSTSLRDSLKASDVPSLRSLQADPYVAMVFLRVAPRLETLNLTLASWNDALLSKMETDSAARKSSIRCFTIRVWYASYHDQWFWKNMAKVLSLFPNTEQLTVIINSLTHGKSAKPARYYFNLIAENVYVLPSLRNVEVRFETFDPQTPGILEVETQSVAGFRIACPLLQTVVDPLRRLWTFRTDRQHSGGFASQLSGKLIEEDPEDVEDLPAPEGSASYDRLGGLACFRQNDWQLE